MSIGKDPKWERVETKLNLLNERAAVTEEATAQIKQNSNERLETINKRFDEVQKQIAENNERDRWVLNLGVAMFAGFLSVVFYLWMEPIEERLNELEDRVVTMLAHGPKRLLSPSPDSGDGG